MPAPLPDFDVTDVNMCNNCGTDVPDDAAWVDLSSGEEALTYCVNCKPANAITGVEFDALFG